VLPGVVDKRNRELSKNSSPARLVARKVTMTTASHVKACRTSSKKFEWQHSCWNEVSGLPEYSQEQQFSGNPWINSRQYHKCKTTLKWANITWDGPVSQSFNFLGRLPDNILETLCSRNSIEVWRIFHFVILRCHFFSRKILRTWHTLSACSSGVREKLGISSSNLRQRSGDPRAHSSRCGL